jgi:hypothetical protein
MYFTITRSDFLKKNLTGSARKSKEGRNTEPERISLISKVRDLEKEIIVVYLVI